MLHSQRLRDFFYPLHLARHNAPLIYSFFTTEEIISIFEFLPPEVVGERYTDYLRFNVRLGWSIGEVLNTIFVPFYAFLRHESAHLSH